MNGCISPSRLPLWKFPFSKGIWLGKFVGNIWFLLVYLWESFVSPYSDCAIMWFSSSTSPTFICLLTSDQTVGLQSSWGMCCAFGFIYFNLTFFDPLLYLSCQHCPRRRLFQWTALNLSHACGKNPNIFSVVFGKTCFNVVEDGDFQRAEPCPWTAVANPHVWAGIKGIYFAVVISWYNNNWITSFSLSTLQ